MDTDPVFPEVPVVTKFASRLKPLWLQALAQPELDLRRQAAEAIASAHRQGMTSLDECIPALTEAMTADQTNSLVKQASAQALIQLDAREVAPLLMQEAALGDFDLAIRVEPALGRWGHSSMKPIWLERLENPQTPRKWLVLAIRGVSLMQVDEAAPALRNLLHDSQVRPEVRLEVARALSLIQPPKLIDDTQKLTTNSPSDSMLDDLLAATLLQNQSDAGSRQLLLKLADHQEPAVAALAIRKLLEVDPQALEEVVEQAATSGDSQLRLLAVEILFKLRTSSQVPQLGRMLSDVHPKVRQNAANALVELGTSEDLAAPVHQIVTEVLTTKESHGLEQAILVLGALKYEPAADRLVELLEDDRPRIFVAAAWALRRMAVPKTAKPMFDKLRRETETSLIRLPLNTPVDWARVEGMYDQLGHLIEALTILDHRPVVPLLLRFLPNPPEPPVPPIEIRLDATFRPELRTRAVWGLGHLHAETLDDDLVRQLQDLLGHPKTARPVRCNIAVALGRMKAETATEQLQALYQAHPSYNPVGYASHWALEKIWGQSLPELPLVPEENWRTGWFLEPLDFRDPPHSAKGRTDS
ncbi:MAG: HEAT repeat domain-containing protein [Pirellulaceae bacterium]